MEYNGSVLCIGPVFEDEIIYPSEEEEGDSNLVQAKLEVVKVPANLGENVVTLKDMISGEQEKLTIDKLLEKKL